MGKTMLGFIRVSYPFHVCFKGNTMSYRNVLLTLAAANIVIGDHDTALAQLRAALEITPKGREWSKIMLAIKMTMKAGKVINHVA